MSLTLPNTNPSATDNQGASLRKILQRLNTSLPSSDHDAPVLEGAVALNVRVLNDARLDFSRGLHANQDSVHKYGKNAITPNGSFADIWSYGPTLPVYPWPEAAETVRIRAGGNAADTAAGLGARSVTIFGLDENWNEVTETIATAGASASTPTVITFRRVYRVRVAAVGALNVSNTGTILIENTASTDVLAEVRAGVGSTEQTHYTIPAGLTGYISRVDAQVRTGTNKDADIRFLTRTNVGNGDAAPYGPNIIVDQWDGLADFASAEYSAFRVYPEKTDIWFSAQGNGATTSVVITYDVFLL
jgi:hypothetical protein